MMSCLRVTTHFELNCHLIQLVFQVRGKQCCFIFDMQTVAGGVFDKATSELLVLVQHIWWCAEGANQVYSVHGRNSLCCGGFGPETYARLATYTHVIL